MREDLERLKSEYTETERLILSRRSVRLYREEQVPDFLVRRILEAGRFAPSAGNCQPWKFIVLRDKALIDDLSNAVVGVSRLLRALIDYTRPGFSWLRPLTSLLIRLMPNDLHPNPFVGLSLLAQGKLKLFHDAPTVIIILKDVRGVSNPDLDCGIAGQNMVLAAHSMGLGTCWVGFTKLALDFLPRWKKRLAIAYPYKFASSLTVGWPRGHPDGMVERQTHRVDWYENGSVETFT